MGLSLASATADGIMTRVPQMTRDAYLMAHLPTPPSYYYVFVRVALERVQEGEGPVREELTKLGGGRAKKAKEKKRKIVLQPDPWLKRRGSAIQKRGNKAANDAVSRGCSPPPPPPRLVTVEPRLD